MRLNTGRTPSLWRALRTSASVIPPVIATIASRIRPEPRRMALSIPGRTCADSSARKASRLSLKPMAFRRRIPSASCGIPLVLTSSSAATISAIRSRNQGSNFEYWCTSATDMPSRRAWAATSKRSGVARVSAAASSSLGAPRSSST